MPDEPASQLEALAVAHDRGEIDDATFEARKAELLAPPAPAPAPIASSISDERPVAWGAPPATPAQATTAHVAESGPSSSFLPSPSSPYPLRYDVAFSEHLSRWKTLLRGVFLIPVWFFLYPVEYAVMLLAGIGWTAVFWRKKYPSWAFAGGSGALGFMARANAYALLQTDRFPSFDAETSPVTLEFDPPPSGYLSRWRVFFWKAALLFPHLIVLSFLWLALAVVTAIAWVAILIVGRYPRGLFPFATGVMRWQFRVVAYFLSFNDRFPPYSLSATAGPAGNGATVTSAVAGLALGGGFTALIITAIILGSQPTHKDADYAALVAGKSPVTTEHSTTGGSVSLTLQRIYDPGDDMAKLLRPAPGERIVVVEWRVVNSSSRTASIASDSAVLSAREGGSDGHDYPAELVVVENHSAPATFDSYSRGLVRAVFVIPAGATPTGLRFKNGFAGVGGVEYTFR